MERPDIQSLLEEKLGSGNVYFQAPPSNLMEYPAIIYGLKRSVTFYADDRPYKTDNTYSVTVIDSNPDSLIPKRILMMKGCAFDRQYISNHLYHNVFSINFQKE